MRSGRVRGRQAAASLRGTTSSISTTGTSDTSAITSRRHWAYLAARGGIDYCSRPRSCMPVPLPMNARPPRPCWCSEQLRSIGTVAQCIRGTWSSAAWRSSKPLNMWCSVTQKVAEAIRTWLLISRSSPGAMTTNSICDGLMIVVIPHWRSSRLFVTLRFRGESG